MKYCYYYSRGDSFPYFNELAELSITYNKEDLTLPQFLQEHKSQMINILINKVEDLERLTLLYDQYKNIKIMFDLKNEDLIKKIPNIKIPFFFYTFINNWDVLTQVLSFHPTDIYISDELGFELAAVAKMAHAAGAQVRVLPNLAQTSWREIEGHMHTQFNGLKKFFIRPEDVELYEPYVDVMEFAGNEKQIATYYKIYAKEHKWFGDLNEIIIDLNYHIDNRGIVSTFGEQRLKCGKKCLKGQHCQICERIAHLSQTLREHDLIVQRDKG